MDHRNETSLTEKMRVSTEQFRPKTWEVWERYAPEEYWYGELFLRTYRSLPGTSDELVSVAAGVELFRAYGLTRELPPDGPANDVPACDSATLLAGDRFLSTSFERISSEHGEAETLQQAIRAISRATRRLGAELVPDDGFETTASEGCEESTSAVTGAVTGQLAVDLARFLSGTHPEADATALMEAGSSVGIAIAGLEHNSPDSQVVIDTDGDGHPTTQWPETPIRERVESARWQFGAAYETVPLSVSRYLDRLASEAETLSD